MSKGAQSIVLPAFLYLACVGGCGGNKEVKLPPEMPKGGMRNLPTKGITSPKPVPPAGEP